MSLVEEIVYTVYGIAKAVKDIKQVHQDAQDVKVKLSKDVSDKKRERIYHCIKCPLRFQCNNPFSLKCGVPKYNYNIESINQELASITDDE